MKNFEKLKIYFLYGIMILIGLVFLLLSFGCQKKDLQAPQAIRIKDFGFSTAERADGLTDVSIGLEVENPNADFISCNASVRVTYQDAAGNVLVTREEILPVIFADSVQGYGKTSTVSGVPAEADFELVMEDAFFIPKTACSIGKGLKIEDLSTTTYEKSPAISGTVVNENYECLGQTMLFAVFRDAEGKIIGGTSEMVRDLKAESELPFTVICQGRDLNTESFTVTASCWFQYLPCEGWKQ